MTTRSALILCLACVLPASLVAQARNDATLQVTVLDETRGVLPGATVTLAGIEASNKATVIAPVSASPQGQAKFENLAPGHYSLKAEFSGFQARTVPDVRIRGGENKQVVVLPIDRLQSSVTVERDRQQAASDRDVTFGTVLTREQIEALSDDPDELRRQLLDIAGPDAKILIDSFEGRDLPPKALIKSIRITRDQFAPEVHFAGELRIEILTQPGIGPVRGNLRSGFYDSATDGKNPLVDATPPAQSWQYGIGLNGTLLSERASFNVNFNGQDSYTTPVLYAATPVGQVARDIPVKSPADNYFFSAVSTTRLRAIRCCGSTCRGRSSAAGTSGSARYDLPERAFATEDSSFGVFIQQNGPIGRRFVSTRGCRSSAATLRRGLPSKPRRSSSTTRSRAAARNGGAEPTRATTGSTRSRLRAGHPLDAHRSQVQANRTTPIRTATISAPTRLRASTPSRRARREVTVAGSGIPASATRTFRAVCIFRTTSRSART